MRRAETQPNIVKRLQGTVSPQVSSDHSGKIMENIAFLNRNCKFLSYVEKEKLIAQIKAQDPEVEALIYAVRDNNISKEEMKSSFYAYLYPKQGSKKPGESSTYAQRTKQATVQKPFQFESRPKKPVPVAAVKLEHSLGDMLKAHKEAKDRIRPATTKNSEAEYHQYYAGTGGRPGNTGNRGISSQDAQGKLQRLSQRLQGGYFESAQARGRTGKTQQGYPGMGKLSVASSMQYGGIPATSPNNYSARGHGRSAYGEQEGGSYADGSSFGQYGSPTGRGNTEYEGTSSDFLLSLGIKRDNLSPEAGGASHRGYTPSGITSQRNREQIFNTQINLADKGGSVSNGKTGHADSRKRHNTDTFGQGDLASRLHGTSFEGGSLKQSVWQQASETEGYDSDVKRKRPAEGKVNLDLKQSGKDLKLSGVSDKTKEVLASLLGDLGDGQFLQNVMKKLEDNQVHLEPETHRVEDVKEEDVYSPKREPEARKSHWDMRNSAIVMGQGAAVKGKPYESAKKRTGSQIEDRIEGRRGVSMGVEGEYPIGLRSEKYVSVNVVKRILAANLIYAEDLVDEIFRHLGDNIVNKNYFAQVIGNYLNCLPEQSGVQTQDIVNKMFEICDRNSDGLISPNDLGSGSMLFTQYRPLQSRERKLYRLFDPQNRGFIIETDIVSVLTKANTIANSAGSSLYSGADEIADVARYLMKDLDREKKGIVTYWDIFLWKDTEEFADLEARLQQYTLQLEIVSSTKKSIMLSNSPPPNRDLKKSQVQATSVSHIYSTYSPNINTQQDTAGLGTYHGDQPRTLATAQSTVIQGGTDPTSAAAVQAANNPNLTSSHLYTQQSPNHQLQNLSAFESISKEIRVEDMLQSVNSGGFGKMYGTDLSISPQSKAFTPIKEHTGAYTGHEALKSIGIHPTGSEYKAELGASKGAMDLLSGDAYKGERFDTASKEGTASKPENYLYLTETKTRENASPKLYETSYAYSSDTKGYMHSPATDYKGYLDLPYKSVEVDKMTSLTGQVDDLLQSSTRAKDNIYQLGTAAESKPYSSTVGTQLESKFYNYGLAPGFLAKKPDAPDYANFTLGTQALQNYGLEHNESILDKKKEEERSYMQSLSSRDNQDISQKPELKESQYSASHGYGHGSPSLLQGYDLKESVVAYNAESEAKDYSDKGKSSATNSPHKSSFAYRQDNTDTKNYGYDAYSASLKESGHHGYQVGQELSSPGTGQYKSEAGSEYRGDFYGYSANRDSLSGYGSVGNERAGAEIQEESWREKSNQGVGERYY